MGLIRSLLSRQRRSRPSAPPSSEPASPTSSGSPASRTPEDDMARVFNKFDSNSDGKISSSELGAVFESLGHPVSEAELGQMMAEADSDGDGFISLDEFVHLNTSRVDPSDALEDLHHAFHVFDQDGSGSISAEEIARVMQSIGEVASVAECRKMINGVDRDGDGMVSFEEFKMMMTRSNPFASRRSH